MAELTEINESGLPRLGAGAMRQPAISYRNLPVKMSDDTRAQLEVLAQLNERSLTEESRLAIEHWVEKSKSDPKVLQRAEQVRADIERDAETKRNAIEAVLGGGNSKPAGAPVQGAEPTASRKMAGASTGKTQAAS